MTARTPSRDRRAGVALVLVLWLLAVLSVIALEIGYFTQLRLRATRNNADALQVLFLARAGVESAVADLQTEEGGPVTLADLREDPDRTYHDVPVGAGTYTLLADPSGLTSDEAEYGLSDECAKVSLNSASAEALARLPGVDADLAAEIVMLREESDGLRDIGDLLLIEQVDPLVLYGEDQNGNGLLDPNEDDGNLTYPPDDGDGRLDRGLAAHVTCLSAVRNRNADGEERVDINSAEAGQIAQRVPSISQQQADSIVEHRKKQEFESIAQLLDVELVEKTDAQQPQARPSGETEEEDGAASGANGAAEAARSAANASRSSGAQPREGAQQREGGQQEPEVKSTGQKAFDLAQFKQLADRVTVSDEDTLQGVINVNTAPVEVLACLPGVDAQLAARIAATRLDRSFETVADLLDVEGMSVDGFKQVCNLVTVRSDVFSVRSFGVLGAADGPPPDTYSCVLAVIDRTGETIRVTSWRELH